VKWCCPVGELGAVSRTKAGPVTQDRLLRDLGALGLEPGSVVIVHSSLSSLGWVPGGAVTVIRALQHAVRTYGTLVMPAHSGDYSDPSLWENPPVPQEWWPVIRETMPAFDPEVAPTRGIGRIPELFRTFPDVLRSAHPHVSFTAWGERAIEILANHGLDDSLGEMSPLARIYDHDGWVLFLGTDFNANTSFHLSEYRSDYATKERVTLGAPVNVEGHTRWRTFSDINYDSSDFGEIGRAFAKSHKQQIHSGKVGMASCLLFRQRIAVDFASKWMHTHRR